MPGMHHEGASRTPITFQAFAPSARNLGNRRHTNQTIHFVSLPHRLLGSQSGLIFQAKAVCDGRWERMDDKLLICFTKKKKDRKKNQRRGQAHIFLSLRFQRDEKKIM